MALSEKPDWSSGFCGCEQLPPNGGHRRWVAYTDIPFAEPVTWEEIESDPPHKLVKRTPEGRCCVTYVVDPVDEGSRLTISSDRALNPIDRFIGQYLPRKVDRSLQDEAGSLLILVQHRIYSGRTDLDCATLVRRDDRGL